jgi:hypothetical protein
MSRFRNQQTKLNPNECNPSNKDVPTLELEPGRLNQLRPGSERIRWKNQRPFCLSPTRKIRMKKNRKLDIRRAIRVSGESRRNGLVFFWSFSFTAWEHV